MYILQTFSLGSIISFECIGLEKANIAQLCLNKALNNVIVAEKDV